MIKTFSQHTLDAFAKHNCNYNQFNNLMQDRYLGRDCYDKDGHKVDGYTADQQIVAVFNDVLGIDYKNATKRERKRAMEDHGKELFRIMEDTIDIAKERGFAANEWYNQFVEERNLAMGNDNLFTTNDEVILNVARVSGDHHDISLRRLGGNESYSLPMFTYGVAVGGDIDLFLMGRKSWNEYVDAITNAYLLKLQTEVFAEVMNFDNNTTVPAAFKGSAALTKANKAEFDKKLQYVSMVNGNVPVTIFGTGVALGQLDNLLDVNWLADSEKEAHAQFGRIGHYGRHNLYEIPQRIDPKEKFNGETLKTLIPDNVLLFIAGEDRWVKVVRQGESEINEVTEKGEANGYMDDMQKYEVQESYGVGTQIGRYHGLWKITS